MKRKLVKHGKSTLIVSLPSKWASRNKLSKGDNIHFKDKGKFLELFCDQNLAKSSLTFDVSKLDRTSLFYFIMAAYRRGFDEIILKFEKPEIIHHRTKNKLNIYDAVEFVVSERLIGIEITHHNEHTIVLSEISKSSLEEFDTVLRRTFVLIVEMSKQLLDGMINNSISVLRGTERKHDNITKLISYCLRLISKYEFSPVEKEKNMFHILCQLDKIVDILKYVSRDQISYNKPIKREAKLIIDQIHNSLLLFQLLYYNLDPEVIYALDKNRNDVKTAVWSNVDKLPEHEVRMIAMLSTIQELILDLTEHRMALEI